MSNPSKVSITRLVRGVSAAIAGWNDQANEPEYAEVRDGALLVRPVADQAAPSDGNGNVLIFEGSATWPASSPPGTIKTIDVPPPDSPSGDGKYLVSIVHRSPETVLSIQASNIMTVDGDVEDIPVAVFAVDQGRNRGVPVQFWLLGNGGRLALVNNSGVTGGFTVSVLVHKA